MRVRVTFRVSVSGPPRKVWVSVSLGFCLRLGLGQGLVWGVWLGVWPGFCQGYI